MKPALSFVLVAMFFLPAAAQPPLTLQESVRAALATSESIRSAEFKREGAKNKISEADSRSLPTVTLGLPLLHLGIMDPSLNAMINNLAPGFSSNMLSEMLTVSQVLYDGGRSKLGHDAVGLSIEMSDQAARLARQSAAFEAANSYLGVLKAESLLQAVLLTQRQAEQHLRDAELREKTGAGSRFETLQAQTALINVQGQIIQARSMVKLARLSLGTDIHQQIGNRPLDPTPSLPVVAVEGIVVGQGMSVPASVIMGSLNWTLYDGGKTLSKVRQGEKSVEADEANLAGLKEGLRLEVEKAISDRDVARERIITSEQGVKMAKTSYELALIRYSGGAGSGTEVIDAMTLVSQAQSGYIQATYEKLGSELRLAKALGIDLSELLSG